VKSNHLQRACSRKKPAPLPFSVCPPPVFIRVDPERQVYDRMTPLKVLKAPLNDYANIQPGDCVVAFSRADIFRIREAIERLTTHKCCVVFGQLPPETRSKQAHLFNDPDSGYDVLVASDAVGMGLNLNIRRIVFHSTNKIGDVASDGLVRVEPSMMKQIAGRAGRRSSAYKDEGMVTCLQVHAPAARHLGRWMTGSAPACLFS